MWSGTWVTSHTRSVGRDLEKSEFIEILPQKKTVDFCELAEALGQVHTWWGADGNVVIERLCISLPYVKKPFNSKVIKSFVPELKNRKYFSSFGFLCSMYICHEHSMYVSHICIMGMLQRVKASLPLTQGTPEVPPDFVGILSLIYVKIPTFFSFL